MKASINRRSTQQNASRPLPPPPPIPRSSRFRPTTSFSLILFLSLLLTNAPPIAADRAATDLTKLNRRKKKYSRELDLQNQRRRDYIKELELSVHDAAFDDPPDGSGGEGGYWSSSPWGIPKMFYLLPLTAVWMAALLLFWTVVPRLVFAVALCCKSVAFSCFVPPWRSKRKEDKDLDDFNLDNESRENANYHHSDDRYNSSRSRQRRSPTGRRYGNDEYYANQSKAIARIVSGYDQYGRSNSQELPPNQYNLQGQQNRQRSRHQTVPPPPHFRHDLDRQTIPNNNNYHTTATNTTRKTTNPSTTNANPKNKSNNNYYNNSDNKNNNKVNTAQSVSPSLAEIMDMGTLAGETLTAHPDDQHDDDYHISHRYHNESKLENYVEETASQASTSTSTSAISSALASIFSSSTIIGSKAGWIKDRMKSKKNVKAKELKSFNHFMNLKRKNRNGYYGGVTGGRGTGGGYGDRRRGGGMEIHSNGSGLTEFLDGIEEDEFKEVIGEDLEALRYGRGRARDYYFDNDEDGDGVVVGGGNHGGADDVHHRGGRAAGRGHRHGYGGSGDGDGGHDRGLSDHDDYYHHRAGAGFLSITDDGAYYGGQKKYNDYRVYESGRGRHQDVQRSTNRRDYRDANSNAFVFTL
ncbi:hypothetical protein ACHAXS_004887 [Conticribra weissflogii]